MQAASRSRDLHERAVRSLPGGDTRFSLGMDPWPTYIESAEGTRVVDVDGVSRLDLIYNATVLIHGHRHPRVIEALSCQLSKGTTWFAPNAGQVELAELLCARVPSVERVRFTNSGTEATMLMIKIARAFTGRDLVLKMDGAYHGSYDGLEFNAKSRESQEAVPYTAGVPANIGCNLIIGRFNDVNRVAALLESYADRLAAVVVTPVESIDSWVAPEPAFLRMLRDCTERHGILLAFDEVISFRTASGGAQQRYGVVPDITSFGKVIGGGLPAGAVGGRAEVMAVTDPVNGPRITHAGTFNGNPMSAAAGVAALALLDDAAYSRLDELGARFAVGLRSTIEWLGLPLHVSQVSSLVSVKAAPGAPASWAQVAPAMRMAMLNRGILGWRLFALPTVMSNTEVDEAIEAISDALEQVSLQL